MPKKRRYKKSNNTTKMNISIVIVIMISILLAVLIYTKSGIVGNKLYEITGGIIGITQYLLPVGLFVLGIKIAISKSEVKIKIVQYIGIILVLAATFSVFQIVIGDMAITDDFSQTIKTAYDFGTQGVGGGSLGALIAIPVI